MLRKAKKKVEYPLSPYHNRVTNGLILSIYRFDYRSYDTDMQVDSLELFTYFYFMMEVHDN